MDRKNAIRLYLSGSIGQITVIAIIVFLLRRIGMVVDYTTVVGMIAIGIGGISSAMWGSIVTVRYRKINFKRIVIDFVNVKQPVFSYLLVLMFLSIEFSYLLMGGMLQRDNLSRTKISRKAHFSRVTEVVECCQMCWNLHRMQHICSRYATKILICIGHFSVEILRNVLS